MIMAGVCLAAIKIGNVMLGLSPITTISLASVVTVIYSLLGQKNETKVASIVAAEKSTVLAAL